MSGLFSATVPEKVEQLARTILKEPVRVTVGERNAAVSSVKQRLQFVGNEEGKLLALRQMLAAGLKPPVLVFVASKEKALALHRWAAAVLLVLLISNVSQSCHDQVLPACCSTIRLLIDGHLA